MDLYGSTITESLNKNIQWFPQIWWDCWFGNMGLKEKLWDSHRSQLWTGSLSHDLCPQNSSSLPVTICSPDLTLPQTSGMWKLAQLSQSRQIHFPLFTDFSWPCAYSRSNRCLKTPNKTQECANNNSLITGWAEFAVHQMLNAAPPGKAKQGASGGLTLAHRPISFSTTGLVHFRSGRCGRGWSGWGRKSHLVHQLFLTFLCSAGPVAHLTISISPPLTPYHRNRCFKIFMWVPSPNPVNSPFMPFPKSPLQVSAQDFVCSKILKTCIFHLWRKMICELYHLNWEIERGDVNHI